MPAGAVVERIAEILFGGHPHLLGLGEGIFFHEFQPLGAAGDVIDGLELVEVLLRDLPQRALPVAAVVGPEAGIDILLVLQHPFEDGAGLGMVAVLEGIRVDAVAEVQDIAVQGLGQRIELTALFGFGEIAELCGEVAKRHHNEPGAVFPRAAGHAGHAFAAVPDRFAPQERLDLVVVFALDRIDDLSRIVFIELRRRADGRARAAVDAGVHAFLEAVILAEFVVEFSHLPFGFVHACV